MKQISDYLETNNQKFVEELIEYLRFPSVSAQSKHKIDMTNCAQWLASHGRSIGLKTKVHKTSGHPIVTLTTKQKTNGSKPHFLVYGHYDVQPPEPLELWTSSPFAPEVRKGNLFARGASDNKGQHFAHLKAVEAYLKTNTELPCDLTFLIMVLPLLLQFLQRQLQREVATTLTTVILINVSEEVIQEA